MRRSAVRAGFTLVEILATLALAGIVLPTLMQGISLSLSTSLWARQQAQAVSLAQGKLDELVATKQTQQVSQSGDFGTDWPEYRWTAAITDWDTTLKQVSVTVLWTRNGTHREVTLTTLAQTQASTAAQTTGQTGGTP